MLAYGRYTHIKKLYHSFLRAPHRFVIIHNLHTFFLPLNLKDQELRRAVSYFKLLRHCLNLITLVNIRVKYCQFYSAVELFRQIRLFSTGS